MKELESKKKKKKKKKKTNCSPAPDGRLEASRNTPTSPGEPATRAFGPGEFKVHDLKNTGDTELVFMTVESSSTVPTSRWRFPQAARTRRRPERLPPPPAARAVVGTNTFGTKAIWDQNNPTRLPGLAKPLHLPAHCRMKTRSGRRRRQNKGHTLGESMQTFCRFRTIADAAGDPWPTAAHRCADHGREAVTRLPS